MEFVVRCTATLRKPWDFRKKSRSAQAILVRSHLRETEQREAHRGIQAGAEVQKYIDTHREKEMLSCCDGWLNSNHYFLGIRFADSAITAHSKKRVAKTVNPEL